MARRTLAKEVIVEGVALHSGVRVRMSMLPAASASGIMFHREDLGDQQIPARYDMVSETRLGTVIANATGATVGVIEHLMAAISGCGIDDVEIVLDGPEPPILDGDAMSYLSLIEQAGFTTKSQEREVIQLLRRVEAGEDEASASLSPAPNREFDFEIAFASRAIGRQKYFWTFSEAGFRRDIAPARTFGFVQELEALNKAGMGRGASLSNTLAIDGDNVINSNLLRFEDEFVRHKILDAIGDLALAGAPIVGRFEGRRSGHALNNRLLRTLFASSENFIRVPLA